MRKNRLTVDVDLWERGPLGILLHATAKSLIREDIDRFERGVHDGENLNYTGAESTLRGRGFFLITRTSTGIEEVSKCCKCLK